MDYYYNKQFGITVNYIDYNLICSKNTWTDYHLIPKSRPFVPPPPVRTMYLDVPGLNGKLDYTDALLGRPALGNRSGSWDFIFANDVFNTPELVQKLRNDLNGKLANIILNGDPEYFYRGRLQVSEIIRNSDGTPTEVTFDFNVGPYKYDITTMTYPTDPIVKPDFNTDPMQDIYVIETTEDIYIYNNGPLTRANVYSTGFDMSVRVENRNGTVLYPIEFGTNEALFDLAHGRNMLKVYGTGLFRLYYCEGRM